MSVRKPSRRQIETSTPSSPEPDNQAAAAPEAEGGNTIEDFASLGFAAYTFDDPVRTPNEWMSRFTSAAMAMYIADRTLRMTKPELIAFIRDAGERRPETPETMFRALDGAQETLEGWGNLLATARARYIVAASAACTEPPPKIETPHADPVPAQPVQDEAVAPVDLADACLWAVQHRARIDREMEEPVEWSDERFDAESGKVNAVFTRAIEEPSTGLREIAAKASLALENYERFVMSLPGKHDDGQRIVHTVLREAASLSAFDPNLSSLIDFSTATMRELHAIHDMTNEVSTVAHAMVSSGRGMARQQRRGDSYDDRLSPAGTFMLWVAEALNAVEDAAYNEIKCRQPADLCEQEIRLRVLAPMVIANGDKIETADFARELLAFAEH